MSKNHGRNQEIEQVLQMQQWERENGRTSPAQGGRMAIYSLNGNIAVGEKTSRFSESQQAFRSDSGRGTGKTKSDRKVPVVEPV